MEYRVVGARFASSMRQMEEYLENLYYDPSHPAAFGGVGAIQQAAKNDGRKIRASDIKEWLSSRDTYTLHKPSRKKSHVIELSYPE